MVSIIPRVDLLGNTVVGWICKLSYFRLDTLSLCTCQYEAPLSPSQATWGKTRGFENSLIKYLYTGTKFCVKSPYFQDSQVKNLPLPYASRSLLTGLVPVQFWSRPYGVMSNALPWERCFSSISLSNPLICPGGG